MYRFDLNTDKSDIFTPFKFKWCELYEKGLIDFFQSNSIGKNYIANIQKEKNIRFNYYKFSFTSNIAMADYDTFEFNMFLCKKSNKWGESDKEFKINLFKCVAGVKIFSDIDDHSVLNHIISILDHRNKNILLRKMKIKEFLILN